MGHHHYSRIDHRSHRLDKTAHRDTGRRAQGCSRRRGHRPDKTDVGQDNQHRPDIQYTPRCPGRKKNRLSIQHRFGNHGRYLRVCKRVVSPIGTRATPANKHDTGPQYRAAGSGYSLSNRHRALPKLADHPAQSAHPARLHIPARCRPHHRSYYLAHHRPLDAQARRHRAYCTTHTGGVLTGHSPAIG